MRRAHAPLLLATLAVALALPRLAASAADIANNGDFEAGAVGWVPGATNGTFTIDASQPVSGGSAAGHVQSAAPGPVAIRSQYWLTTAAPGNQYAMSLAVRIPAATITAVTARIEFVKTDGSSLASNLATQVGTTAGYVPIATTSITAPPGTQHVLIVITGTATAAGARFSVDDIVITETLPPVPTPTVVPTFVDDPPPAEDPGPATPRRHAAASDRTDRGASTARDTAADRGIGLFNTTFDANLTGWTIARGRAWTDSWIPGEGQSMVLYAGSSTTVWVEQVIGGIEPGAWYQANALLSTRGNVEAGWMRIAWHSTDDGNGAAITADDSFAVTASEQRAEAAAPRYQVVGTGAIQAPPIAGSVPVRFLLRSDDPSGAWLIIDNVSFARTQAPDPSIIPPRGPVAATTPQPSALATPASAMSSTTPAAEREAAATRPVTAPRTAPTPAAVATPSDGRIELAPGVVEAQRAIRMTQILPDPAHPGRDQEYEWIELTNLGVAPVSVEGMTIRDNSGSVMLPALVIPPGGMLVVTARLADVVGATAFRLPQGIGNGLGNSGDRLVLASADGRQVDAFSYGDDATFLVGARIPVPGTGRALERRFDPDGAFREAVVVDQPTPGRPRAVAASTPAPTQPATGPTEATAATGALGTWVVLLALGAGLLGGVVAQRVSSITRDRRR